MVPDILFCEGLIVLRRQQTKIRPRHRKPVFSCHVVMLFRLESVKTWTWPWPTVMLSYHSCWRVSEHGPDHGQLSCCHISQVRECQNMDLTMTYCHVFQAGESQTMDLIVANCLVFQVGECQNMDLAMANCHVVMSFRLESLRAWT